MMQPLTFITLTRDPEASREIGEALINSTRTRLLSECDTDEQLLADVARLRPSAALITLRAENSDKEFALIKQLVAATPSTVIITGARDSSPALILGSMRSGEIGRAHV